MALRLATLLSTPFGPYSDDEILVPGACRDKFTIDDLTMEQNGAMISLNKTEFVVRPPPNHPITKDPVYFFGTLEIESLDWLTDIGKARIQRDLRKRDTAKSFSGGESRLTLESVYGKRKNEGSRVLVRIQGKKNLYVQWLGANNQPNSILIYSMREDPSTGESLTRAYTVESFRTDFWMASYAYIQRAYLWTMIKEICQIDDKKTPMKKRTVHWLVREYMTHIRPRDEHLRIISLLRNEEEITEERRHLRRITEQEVLCWFAGAAEWILAQLLASSSSAVRMLDVRRWIQWCYDVRVGRIRAAKRSVSWGFPAGLEDDRLWLKKGLDLTPFGETKEFWQKKLSNAQKKPKKKPKQSTHRTRAQARTPLSSSVGGNDLRDKQRFIQPAKPTRFLYDADFSEESTAGETDYEEEKRVKVTDNTPRFCAARPTIPAGRFDWQCPGDRCEFKIDLFQLAKRMGSHMKQANDPWLQGQFEKAVSEHYSKVHVERRVVEKTRERDEVIKMEID